jgi:hypothetical protein
MGLLFDVKLNTWHTIRIGGTLEKIGAQLCQTQICSSFLTVAA